MYYLKQNYNLDTTHIPGIYFFVGINTNNSLNSIEMDDIFTRKTIIDYISKFSNFREKWDGYNAKEFNETVIKKTVQFINDLPKYTLANLDSDNISPNPNGTVTIQWKNDKKSLFSLDIGKSQANIFIKHSERIPEFINGINLSNKEEKQQIFKSLSEFIAE